MIRRPRRARCCSSLTVGLSAHCRSSITSSNPRGERAAQPLGDALEHHVLLELGRDGGLGAVAGALELGDQRRDRLGAGALALECLDERLVGDDRVLVAAAAQHGLVAHEAVGERGLADPGSPSTTPTASARA